MELYKGSIHLGPASVTAVKKEEQRARSFPQGVQCLHHREAVWLWARWVRGAVYLKGLPSEIIPVYELIAGFGIPQFCRRHHFPAWIGVRGLNCKRQEEEAREKHIKHSPRLLADPGGKAWQEALAQSFQEQTPLSRYFLAVANCLWINFRCISFHAHNSPVVYV